MNEEAIIKRTRNERFWNKHFKDLEVDSYYKLRYTNRFHNGYPVFLETHHNWKSAYLFFDDEKWYARCFNYYNDYIEYIIDTLDHFKILPKILCEGKKEISCPTTGLALIKHPLYYSIYDLFSLEVKKYIGEYNVYWSLKNNNEKCNEFIMTFILSINRIKYLPFEMIEMILENINLLDMI